MFAVILKGLMSVLTRLFMSMASEKVIEWLLFYLAEKIVESTKTPHDNEFLGEIKKAYKFGKKKDNK